MTAPGNKELGARGEARALEYLLKKGYTLREKNVRSKLGEIDLIVERGDTLVFVEVKSGKGDGDFPAWVHFDRRKQSKYVSLASAYLSDLRGLKKNVRFDLVAVTHDTNHIEHFENVITL